MSRVKKKTNKFLIRRIIAVVVIIILILVIKNIAFNLSVKNQQKQMRLLYNNEFVDLSYNVYIEDSVIYMSEEDIKKFFDSTIYYNVGDKELITTHNMHVAVLHLGENQIIVNDSSFSIQGTLKEIDSKIYLPITDLGIVYDIESQYSEDTNMVIIDSTLKSKSQVLALSKIPVKQRRGPFANTVEKVKKGDYLFVIEDGSTYKKVRTASRKYWICKIKKSFRY